MVLTLQNAINYIFLALLNAINYIIRPFIIPHQFPLQKTNYLFNDNATFLENIAFFL